MVANIGVSSCEGCKEKAAQIAAINADKGRLIKQLERYYIDDTLIDELTAVTSGGHCSGFVSKLRKQLEADGWTPSNNLFLSSVVAAVLEGLRARATIRGEVNPMAKPDNPGQGNGNNNGNEGNDEAGQVVVVETDDGQERFEGTATIAIDGGCLLVGKGPEAAFANGAWLSAWVEPLEAPVEP